jgi:stearoyl-CoA desaturase (delta-9 desaturase)
MQFVFALLGNITSQKSPLWWAAHHRHHHRFSDQEEDVHSPTQHGFMWSHMGWFLSDVHKETKVELVRDLAKFPELVWMDRNPYLMPVALAAILTIFGGTGALVWGFFLSTVLVWHSTFTINSLAHVWGTRRYETTDTSKNNFFLALVTLGEGWHNNHHRYMGSIRLGFFWWEVDIAYYVLKIMAWVGLIWDVRTVPESLLQPQSKGAMVGAESA